MDKFVVRPILVLGYYCSFTNFDYIYIIDISISTANMASRFTESYAWATSTAMFGRCDSCGVRRFGVT